MRRTYQYRLYPNRRMGQDLAELVVIFPTNVWEYDVLDYFPFKD